MNSNGMKTNDHIWVVYYHNYYHCIISISMCFVLKFLFISIFFLLIIFILRFNFKHQTNNSKMKFKQIFFSLLNLNNRHRRLDHWHNKQKEDTWTMKRSYHWLNCHPILVLNLMHLNWLASMFHWHHDGKVINSDWIWKKNLYTN